MTWTIEQVVAFANSPARFVAGEQVAVAANWSRLGSSDTGLWGRYDGTAAEPYAVVIDHVEVRSRCGCPSRVRPCKHVIGLLVLWVRGHVAHGVEPPPEVGEWLRRGRPAPTATDATTSSDAATDGAARDGEHAGSPAAGGSAADPGAPGGDDVDDGDAAEPPSGGAGAPESDDERRDRLDRQRDERIARLYAGLRELDRWLEDRCRLGLADPALARYATWDELAARLTDARAGALANRVRRLAGRVGSGAGWQADVLAELGILHLIVQGALRLGELPPALADRVAVLCGWQVRSADVLAAAPEPGDWFVIGRSDAREDLVEVRRVWMLGSDGASALVLSFAAYQQSLDDVLRPGEIVTVDVHRYPGGAQRVLLGPEGVLARTAASERVSARLRRHVATVAVACDRLGGALADEPWSERQPLLVRAAPSRDGGRWWLGDHTGRLPLRHDVDGRALAVLLAGSAGAPVTCAVEWTADGLAPLTLFLPDRTIDIGRRADPSFVAEAAA